MDSRTQTVAIAAGASTATAAQLKTRLLDALGRGGPIEIDASGADGCDTAIAQVLIAVVREAERRQVGLEWHDVSDAFAESVERLGIRGDLGLPGSDAAASEA